MKNLLSTAFLLLLSISLLAQNNEKQAIIEVIEGEHVAAASKDFNKFAGYYDQNENVIWGNGITYSYKGWAEVGKTIKSLMEQDPEPMDPSVFYNYQISIAGNKAWATFDKKEKGGSHPISKEQRILIKKNGEWKLVTALFFPM